MSGVLLVPLRPRRRRPPRTFAWGSRAEAAPLTERATELAMRIAFRFADSDPTPEQLAAEFPMSRASAYRYLRMLRDAKGQP